MSKRSKRNADSATISRRKFLRCITSMPLLGLSASPAAALFSTILGGISQKAWAAELGFTPKRSFFIHCDGGPSKWQEQPLTAYSSAGFNQNPMVVSHFNNVGGRLIGGSWDTVSLLGGLRFPTMWSYNLPSPNNGSRPMSDLLQNLLVLQGITTKNGGHDGSQELRWRPLGATRSVTAFSGDSTNNPFPAINLSAAKYSATFKSQTAKSFQNVSSSGNMLSTLLDPFQPGGSTQFKTNKNTLSQAYDNIFPLLNDLAGQGHVGAQAVMQSRDSALQLVEINFANLATVWTALLNKYTDLVRRSFFDPSNPLPGLTDLPIGEGGTGAAALYQIDDNDGLGLEQLTDFGSIVNTNTTVNNLASGFAFAEYVLTQNLTRSLALGLGGVSNLRNPVTGQNFGFGNDSHRTGFYPQILLGVLRSRAIHACLLELITQLITANIFSDTVIDLAGEFNRDPRTDLTGADHGYQGLSHSIYSGSFNGPLVLGNLRNDSRLGWGAGGVVPGLGRQLELTDLVATLAHVIGVSSPITSAQSVITLGSNGITPNIPLSTWV